MTIEIYQPGRDKPIIVSSPSLFDAVDGSTDNQVLLKPLIDTKGFIAFQDSNKFYYEKNREKNENIDDEGILYKVGDVLQLTDGVIAVGS